MASGFIIFAFDRYYPDGGEADIFGVYETLEEADAALPRADVDRMLMYRQGIGIDAIELFFKDKYQIYDVSQRKTVAKFKRVQIDAEAHTLFPDEE
jgi:hypothetical protein